MRKMRLSFLIILITLFGWLVSRAEIHIYSIDYPNKKQINFGPCFIGDSLHTYFDLYYDQTENVYIQNGEPTLKVFQSPLDQSSLQNQFRTFDPNVKRQPLPRILNKNQANLKLPFYFHADSHLVTFPIGVYHAKAMIALAKSADNSIVIADTFTLKAKKTDLYIDGFTDSLYFDSVYVFPRQPKELYWLVKSTKVPYVEVVKQEFKYLSPKLGEEFEAPEFQQNAIFNEKYQTVPWKVSYKPINLGKDSALMKLYYHPDKAKYPDSTRFASVKVFGIGVEQKLMLSESNFSIINDTINLGNVRTGQRVILTGILENKGNIPIFATSESIFNTFNESVSETNTINKKAFINKAIKPNEVTQFQIYCLPNSDGLFIDKYIIKTNIKDRNIYGIPANVENKEIVIKGTAISPLLRIPFDTLDFGTVVINEINCPSKKDTIINITNSGSADLIVKNIEISPNEKFIISEKSFQIQPGKTKQLLISFIADDGVLGQFNAEMKFITNMQSPNFSVGLSVTRIPRVNAWLEIPLDLKATPGKVIDVPILIKDKDYKIHPAKYAKNFNTIITFDTTILRYNNRKLVGTASEGADAEIIQHNSGKYSISINKSDYLAANDTLIILRFSTYLGNVASSNISFEKNITKFGDGLCDDVLKIEGNIMDGLFALDSVCGLQYKTKILPKAIIIKNISPNPATDEIEMEFLLASDSQCKIEIYDTQAQLIRTLASQKYFSGLNKQNFHLAYLSSGIYFIKVTSLESSAEKYILITR